MSHSKGFNYLDLGRNFLRQFEEDISSRETPAEYKADWQLLVEWSGARKGELTDECRERMLCAWSTYILRGVSPCVGLLKAFDQFKQDEVKDGVHTISVPYFIFEVFDRQLATNEEIVWLRRLRINRAADKLSELNKLAGIPRRPLRVHVQLWLGSISRIGRVQTLLGLLWIAYSTLRINTSDCLFASYCRRWQGDDIAFWFIMPLTVIICLPKLFSWVMSGR